jgi:hypothetical protein
LLTPIGTLDISLKSLKTDHTWKLEFQVRGISGQDHGLVANKPSSTDQTFHADYLKNAEAIVQQTFGSKSTLKPEKLMDRLEETIQMSRREWPPSVMRGLADAVLKSSAFRKITQVYLERWWNLVGFLLRPGFGFALDDFRLKELWKVILSDLNSQLPQEALIQIWICLRRVAGGLSKGQQMQAISEINTTLFNKKSGKIEVKSKAELYPYSEKIRVLGAMELVDNSLKIRWGNALVERLITGQGGVADYWSLGRIGARHLLYGSLVNVLQRSQVEIWIDQLLNANLSLDDRFAFLIGQLARKTEHREINLSSDCIKNILTHFADSEHLSRLEQLLLEENRLTQQEQENAFGDRLPAGLFLEKAEG